MYWIVSRAACEHLAYTANERVLGDTENILEDSAPLRLLVLAAAVGAADPVMLSLSMEQARALDMVLTDKDPREGELPDGTPVLAMVRSLWQAMTATESVWAAGPEGAGDAGDNDQDGRPDQNIDARARATAG